MKYYKLNHKVYAFESDGSQDDYIKPEMVEMTIEEIDRHLNPKSDKKAIYKQEALYLLQCTDLVALRFWKAGLEYPLEWIKYTEALRSIVRADEIDIEKPLPVKPHIPDNI